MNLVYFPIKAPELACIWNIFEFAWGSRDSAENAAALSSMNATAASGPLAIEDGVAGDDLDDLDEEGEGVSPKSPDLSVDGADEHRNDMEVDIPDHDKSPASTQDETSPSSQIPEMTRKEFQKWAEANPNMAQKNMDGTQPPASPSPSSPVVTDSAPEMGPPAPPSPGTIARKDAIKARLEELRRECSKLGWCQNISSKDLALAYCFQE